MAERLKPVSSHLLTIGIVAIAGSIALFLGDLLPSLPMEQVTVERAIAVLTGMLVVALFLERALAVILDFAVPDETEAQERIAFAPDPLDADLTLVAENDKKQQRFRFVAGYFLAILIGLAGMRALAGLFTEPPKLAGLQGNLFALIDLHVTALLLAGGSAGIAAIIDHLRIRSLLSVRRLKLAAGCKDQA
jgi:hypothetical protein